MPKILKQHTTGVDNIEDWGSLTQFENTDIASIPDTLEGGVLDKIGSSIPTPFARMYLFETAFSIVNEKQAEANPLYQQLVSDCLDFLQFLYLEGNKGKVKYRVWNRENQLKELKNSTFHEHRLLGEALSVFFESDNQLKNVDNIILIYFVYQDNEGIKEKLIGGTSPFTLVYSSPNWKETAQKFGWTVNTSVGDILFDNIPYSLERRNDDFQEYMYKLINAFSSNLPTSFYQYVFKKLNPRFGASVQSYTSQDFLNEYSPIKYDLNGAQYDLRVSGSYIASQNVGKRKDEVENKSGFLMQPTNSNFLQELDEDGNPLSDIRLPLVLCKGNHALTYVDKPWVHTINVPDDGSHIQSRSLPGISATKYPYVTIGDFFEDDIFELPFLMDKNYFLHAKNAERNPIRKYALPIRKQYFNYFNSNDLERNLTIRESNDAVIYELAIPIKNNRFITFQKSYNKKENILKSRFNLGLFPFYKIIDNESQNKYSSFLVSEDKNVKVSFFKMKDIIHNKSLKTTITPRTVNAALKTFAYSLENSSFDGLEIETVKGNKKYSAVILPKMEEKSISESPHKFYFAIDFGTTNTHVVYANKNDLDAKVIHDLDIKEEDRQMVLLSELDAKADTLEDKIIFGMGNIIRDAAQYFDTEFVPGFINKDTKVQFPIRTVVAEHESYLNQSKESMFGNLNIGFGFEKLNSRSENYHETDLKWSLTQGYDAVKRVHVFIRELLWVIKNKCILNDGSLDIIIQWMYPMSMSRSELRELSDIWRDEITNVFGTDNNVKLGESLESVVPYYAVAELRSQNTLNVDIGGGTSDILFFDKEHNKNYHTSFRFAGNDIWGEGVGQKRTNKDNGFVIIGGKELEKKDLELSTIFKHFKNNEKKLSSSDLCALLFNEEEEFNFTRTIRQYPHMTTILYIHLAAIIYHISQILNELDSEIPALISFTGRGSKYLEILSSRDEDIREYVILLFEKYTGKKAKSITKVITNSNPKRITAKGALLQLVDNEQLEKPDKLTYITTINSLEKIESILGKEIKVEESDTPQTTERKPFDELEIDKIQENAELLEKDFFIFLESLKDRDIINFLRDFNVPLSFKYKGPHGSKDFEVIDILKETAMVGFNEKLFQIKRSAKGETINESPFFWFLKEGLYELSKKLAEVKPI